MCNVCWRAADQIVPFLLETSGAREPRKGNLKPRQDRVLPGAGEASKAAAPGPKPRRRRSDLAPLLRILCEQRRFERRQVARKCRFHLHGAGLTSKRIPRPDLPKLRDCAQWTGSCCTPAVPDRHSHGEESLNRSSSTCNGRSTYNDREQVTDRLFRKSRIRLRHSLQVLNSDTRSSGMCMYVPGG